MSDDDIIRVDGKEYVVPTDDVERKVFVSSLRRKRKQTGLICRRRDCSNNPCIWLAKPWLSPPFCTSSQFVPFFGVVTENEEASDG